jgi:glycosyltransferase involved in cell wall biosynthesis
MHVLLIPSWFPRHRDDVAGIFFLDQAKALRRAGHQVGVLAQFPRRLTTILNRLPRTEDCFEDHVFISRVSFLAWLPKIPLGTFALWLRATIRQFIRYRRAHGTPDVIHAHSTLYGGAIAFHLGRRFGIPVVITEHSSSIARGQLRGWELRLVRRVVKNAGAFLAVSESTARDLQVLCGKHSREIKVVPNLVAERFTNRAIDGQVASGRRLRILNVGSHDENKAQGILIKAFAATVLDKLQAELWLVGDGPKTPFLRSLAAGLGVADRVCMIGAVPPDSIPAVMSDCDLLVISSRYETFGVVAAEALVMGKPVVSTDCGGPREILLKGDGLLVPVDSPDDLGAAIANVLLNLGDYDPINIATRARARFSGGVIASELTDIYRSVQVK